MKGHFYWSVRRELWENRLVLLVPVGVAGVVLAGFLYMLLFGGKHEFPVKGPDRFVVMALLPYSIAASLILLSSWAAGLFYSLDALSGERRDRSILFWKSMPVSDATTVLAKASIPLVILPVVAMAVVLATQALMLLFTGGAQRELIPFGVITLVMLYGMAVHALWFAPIIGWALLVSAWSRRFAWVWFAAPFFALWALEAMSLRTAFTAAVVKYRLMGAMTEAFSVSAMSKPIYQLWQLEPAKFFSSANMWAGLAFAAACIFLAIRLRRYRDPN